MRKKAEAQELRIYKNHKVKVDPKANGFMHNSRSGIARLYRKKRRSLNENIIKPNVPQSVLDRVPAQFNNPNEKYNSWILKHSYDIEPW